MRVTRENLNACKAFVDFWEDHVIIPSECERALATKPSQPTTNGFVVLPYVRGVSERIGRVLKQQSLRVSFKPQRTINSLFPRPKQQDETDRPLSGIVYSVQSMRFCILWPDRKSTEDADF